MSEPFRTCEPLDEGLITGGIEVVSFLDSDGASSYRVRIADGMDVVTVLGLLRVAEHEALAAGGWTPGGDE